MKKKPICASCHNFARPETIFKFQSFHPHSAPITILLRCAQEIETSWINLANAVRVRIVLAIMFSSDFPSALRKGRFYLCAALTTCAAFAGELAAPAAKNQPKVAAASKEGEDAIRGLQLP